MLAASFVEAAEKGSNKPTKYNRTPVETIPLGRTDQNNAGYKQDLVFSTLSNSRGKLYFDMALTLEGPDVKDDYVM